MGLYRKKPVTIEARRYFAESKENIINWLYDNHQTYYLHNDSLRVVTLEGEMRAEFGDWIIKGVQGEFYPCKPEIFTETYEQIDKRRNMAEPKTEVDRRFDRIEKAISTMAAWLVSAQTGFGQKDMDGINDILYGTETAPEGSSSEAE